VIAEREIAPAQKAKPARQARQSVFRNATILSDNGARYAVAIKDVSEGGARIEFYQDVPLEGIFTVSEPMLNLRRRARLSWRKDGSAGLIFVD
jgi:hypothetical protein